MHFNRLYDHVLAELEYGRTEIGINLLVGMLDAADLQHKAIDQARDDLQDHPLHAMLLEDPLFADARQRPGNPVHRLNMLKQHSYNAVMSSTGRRLFAATSEIAFARALRQRREHAEHMLHRAWRSGQKIWLIADPESAMMATLGGRDTSNILVSSENDLRDASGRDIRSGSAFDLILAPFLPDLCSKRAMQQLVDQACQHLSDQGNFVISALLPGHPGSGWRRACFSWEPNCHDDAALARMTAPGVTTHNYRDETGCVAWLEMRRI